MANPFFGAEYYLARNTDVATAVNGDAAAAEAHYYAFGAAEGRKPVQWFDGQYYQATYADLSVLEPNQLFDHFINFGIGESRSPIEGLNLDQETFGAYAAANQDLVEAYGIEDVDALTPANIADLATHFFRFGIDEDRPGAPVLPVDTDRSDIASALENLQAANEAVVDFLADVPELEYEVAGAPVTVEAGEATAQNVREYVAYVEGEMATDIDAAIVGADFANQSESVQNEFIAAREAVLAAEVSAAKAAVPANTQNLLAAVDVAAANLTAANQASEEAALTLGAEAAAFDLANAANAVRAANLTVGNAGYDPNADNSGPFFLVNGRVYAGQDGTTTAVPFANLVEQTGVNRVTEYLNAFNAAETAETAVANATQILQGAVGRVYVVTNEAYSVDPAVDPATDYASIIVTAADGTVTVDYDEELSLIPARGEAAADFDAAEAGDLHEALEAQSDFAELVAQFTDARSLESGLTEAETAVVDARAAIENPVDDEDAPGLGINLVDIEAGVTATADIEELFLFTAEEAGDITGFGAEDLIFFGSQYTFVELAEGVDFAEVREGDAGVLEVFYQVQGANTVFYVENEAEAGRDLNLDNITVVQLTGVNGGIAADDYGFVAIA